MIRDSRIYISSKNNSYEVDAKILVSNKQTKTCIDDKNIINPFTSYNHFRILNNVSACVVQFSHIVRNFRIQATSQPMYASIKTNHLRNADKN